MGQEISSAINLHITEYELIEKALLALKRKNLGNAEKTKTGYGTCKSSSKYDALIKEAESCDELINRLVQEFS